MEELTEPGFEKRLAREGEAVVLFWAVWCPHCHAQSAVLTELSRNCPHTFFARVNTGQESRLTEKYRIHAVPTLLFFRYGEEVLRLCGFQKAQKIAALLAKMPRRAESLF